MKKLKDFALGAIIIAIACASFAASFAAMVALNVWFMQTFLDATSN